MTNVIPIRRPIEMACTACGSLANAACDCGAPYLPAGQRAAEAIVANPRMSDRAIAEQIGVGTMTVNRARKQSTVPHGTVDVETRIGLDGKERRMPVRRAVEDDDEEFSQSELASRNRGSFMLRAQEAKNFAFYSGKVDQKLVEFARTTASAWCELVETLEKKL